MFAAIAVLGAACTPVHVVFLASDAWMGRQNGTDGSVAAQDYLIDYLVARGAEALDGTQDRASFREGLTGGTNIVARIPGSDLADEVVLVGAHYDHLASCDQQGGDTICNGATDNAAGVAVALEIMAALARAEVGPRRTVVFAFWDREEDGLLGSLAFRGAHPELVDDVVAYVNYDIQGANLLPGLRSATLAVGAETGGAVLEDAVAAAGATSPLDLRQLSLVFGQGRSDHATFAAAQVPVVFFTDATGPCYHTTLDDWDVALDPGKLDEQRDIGIALVDELAAGTTTPVWNPSAPLADYDDVTVLHELLVQGQADLARFTPSQQATMLSLLATFASIVAEGPAGFDAADVNTVLFGALSLVDILASGTCDGFLE